jgi:hypothetical protein
MGFMNHAIARNGTPDAESRQSGSTGVKQHQVGKCASALLQAVRLDDVVPPGADESMGGPDAKVYRPFSWWERTYRSNLCASDRSLGIHLPFSTSSTVMIVNGAGGYPFGSVQKIG